MHSRRDDNSNHIQSDDHTHIVTKSATKKVAHTHTVTPTPIHGDAHTLTGDRVEPSKRPTGKNSLKEERRIAWENAEVLTGARGVRACAAALLRRTPGAPEAEGTERGRGAGELRKERGRRGAAVAPEVGALDARQPRARARSQTRCCSRLWEDGHKRERERSRSRG